MPNPACAGAERRRDALGILRDAARHRDARARARERTRDRLADALAGAGDERDLALQRH